MSGNCYLMYFCPSSGLEMSGAYDIDKHEAIYECEAREVYINTYSNIFINNSGRHVHTKNCAIKCVNFI